jgi:hypothetical protein
MRQLDLHSLSRRRCRCRLSSYPKQPLYTREYTHGDPSDEVINEYESIQAHDYPRDSEDRQDDFGRYLHQAMIDKDTKRAKSDADCKHRDTGTNGEECVGIEGVPRPGLLPYLSFVITLRRIWLLTRNVSPSWE